MSTVVVSQGGAVARAKGPRGVGEVRMWGCRAQRRQRGSVCAGWVFALRCRVAAHPWWCVARVLGGPCCLGGREMASLVPGSLFWCSLRLNCMVRDVTSVCPLLRPQVAQKKVRFINIPPSFREVCSSIVNVKYRCCGAGKRGRQCVRRRVCRCGGEVGKLHQKHAQLLMPALHVACVSDVR